MRCCTPAVSSIHQRASMRPHTTLQYARTGYLPVCMERLEFLALKASHGVLGVYSFVIAVLGPPLRALLVLIVCSQRPHLVVVFALRCAPAPAVCVLR